MSRQLLAVSRRRFLQSTTLGAAAAATGILHAPAVLRAQGAPVKVGVLHPVSGALSYSGQQGRIGALMAIDPEQRLAVLAAHDLVRRPQFVDQGARVVHARIRFLVVPA